jgi:hypothetical protein
VAKRGPNRDKSGAGLQRHVPPEEDGVMVAPRALAVVLVAVGLAALAPAAQAARRPSKAESAAIRSAKQVRREAGRAKTTSKVKRRNARLAKRTLRAFRARRWCAGLTAVGSITGKRRVRRAVNRVERVVARGRLAKACQARSAGATTKAQDVSGGGFPAEPLPPPGADENEQGEEMEIPSGPFRPGLKPGAPSSNGQDAPPARAAPPFAQAAAVTDPVDAFVATDLGNSGWTGKVQDPTEASSGNVVLVAVNRNLGYSTNGGASFTYIDPTTIFPSADGGICCDMVLQYDKPTNRFFWLIQYNCSPGCDGSSTSENRYRLAIASPSQVASSGATAWKYFDFTSRTFGEAGQWMDFPDMALGDQSLYFTFDFPRKGAAAWARIHTADLVNLNSIGFRYYKKTGDYVLKTVQNTHARGWIARRKSDSEFELTHWDDGSIYVYHHTVGFTTPPTENCGENGPDGQNFLAMFGCGGFSSSISGAARRSNGDIWLAWTAGRRIKGKSTDLFPHSHIELLTIDSSTLNVTRVRSIWNPNYAWAYPGLTASAGGEVAMTYVTGGGTAGYFNWGVGFVTNTEFFRRVATGQAGAVRIGDYYTARPAFPSTKRFSAAGYVKDASGNFHPYWALFGRRGDKPVTLTIVPNLPLVPIQIKPLPPPPQPAQAKITLSCPQSVRAGQNESITVSGHLDPATPSTSVSVTYTRPKNAPAQTVHTVTTNATSDFSDSLQPTINEIGSTITVSTHVDATSGHTAADASCDVVVNR